MIGTENITYNCLICDKPVLNYIPEFCCSGIECGCRGMPIEPCICENCYNEMDGSHHKAWELIMKNKNVSPL